MTNPQKDQRLFNDSNRNQLNVLKVLSSAGVISAAPRPYHITEIAVLAGNRDEREIQRQLFILEGQKLVSPVPAGDFTSKTWHITNHGLHAMSSISY